LPIYLYGYAGDGSAEFADTEVDSKALLYSKTGLFSINYDATTFIKALSGVYAGFTLAMTDPPYSVPEHPDQAIYYFSRDSVESVYPTLIIHTNDAAPIPLPGALLLFGTGLLSLAGWRKLRKG
jgi:hypothetical protein